MPTADTTDNRTVSSAKHEKNNNTQPFLFTKTIQLSRTYFIQKMGSPITHFVHSVLLKQCKLGNSYGNSHLPAPNYIWSKVKEPVASGPGGSGPSSCMITRAQGAGAGVGGCRGLCNSPLSKKALPPKQSPFLLGTTQQSHIGNQLPLWETHSNHSHSPTGRRG